MSNPNWSTRAQEAFACAVNPTALLQALPPAPADLPMRELGKLWRAITSRREPRVIIAGFPEHQRGAIENFLSGLQGSIVDRLRADGSHEAADLIPLPDFQPSGLQWLQKTPDTLPGFPRQVYLGCVDVLPKDHWLRSLLPVEELYQTSSDRPALVLGSPVISMAGNPAPRVFSLVEDAVRLTRELAGHQRERIRIAEQNERLERQREEREAVRTPEAMLRRIEELTAQVRELQAAGNDTK